MGTPIRPIGTTRVTGTAATTVPTGARTAGVLTTNAAAAAAARATVSDVVVDLDAAPAKATIVRGTTAVETPSINLERASGLLENFIPVAHNNDPRGVRQSIAEGTIVARGTAVDVDFLTPNQVTLGIFEGVHADLQNLTVNGVASLLQDPEVTPLLQKSTNDLTAAERQNLTAKLATINVGVDDTVPSRSLAAAVVGLKTAEVFR
jgi:hypothetical protein